MFGAVYIWRIIITVTTTHAAKPKPDPKICEKAPVTLLIERGMRVGTTLRIA